MIYAFFLFVFVQKSFLTEKVFLYVEIHLTTRGPLCTCLGNVIVYNIAENLPAFMFATKVAKKGDSCFWKRVGNAKKGGGFERGYRFSETMSYLRNTWFQSYIIVLVTFENCVHELKTSYLLTSMHDSGKRSSLTLNSSYQYR